jgi:hypothetical protein
MSPSSSKTESWFRGTPNADQQNILWIVLGALAILDRVIAVRHLNLRRGEYSLHKGIDDHRSYLRIPDTLLLDGRISIDEATDVLRDSHHSERRVGKHQGPSRISLQEPIGCKLVAVGFPICVCGPVTLLRSVAIQLKGQTPSLTM